LRVARDKQSSETQLLGRAVQLLQDRLPSAWLVEREPIAPGPRRPDAIFTVTAPDGREIAIVVEAKRSVEPRDVDRIVDMLQEGRGGAPFVVAPFLSPATRARLIEREAGYADSTGNFRIAIDDPLVLIETSGAERDPEPLDRPLRSLKGRGAGRCVRALCDFIAPYGVRDLAKTASLSPATLSRVVDLLVRDLLVERGPRGDVQNVDVSGVIRRWAKDYSFQRSNSVETFLEPRGFGSLRGKLGSAKLIYAATGSLVAAAVAPIAAPRLVQLYVRDLGAGAQALSLRPTEDGANVMLAEPFDDVVFERTTRRDGITSAALSQVSVDLLTGPGRSPSEGEALLEWMGENPDAWRSRP
jgi:hypothetical protein